APCGREARDQHLHEASPACCAGGSPARAGRAPLPGLVAPLAGAGKPHLRKPEHRTALEGRGSDPRCMTTLLSDLRARLSAPVIGPADPSYDEDRTVFLPTIDRRPAAIAQPVNAAEIASVVAVARERSLELAVRSGGHSGAGHGVTEGGI